MFYLEMRQIFFIQIGSIVPAGNYIPCGTMIKWSECVRVPFLGIIKTDGKFKSPS